jgi:glycosyltransferase involved in cell wall biosynthesis
MCASEPTVSVITASYNHAAYIGAAIESVRRQDYAAWEILVADDASTDGTLDVMASYGDDPRIRVFPFAVNREHHMRNHAAERAAGKYLAFLNSDDMFLPGKLRKQVEALEANPRIAAVFTHVAPIDDRGNEIPGHDLERTFAAGNQASHQWLRRFFLSGNCLCISSAMIRRDRFAEMGGFNPLLIQIADLDLWIRLCLAWDIHVIPEPLTAMRVFPGRGNLSAAGPATNSRLMMEYHHACDHYFSADGLAMMPAIFPELAMRLPEDTPAWRCYLLARMATTLPNRALRLLGFRRLHELLKEDEARKSLSRRNRRLLRALFVSEGMAALDKDHPGMLWKVRFAASQDSQQPEVYTCWTAAVDRGVVCFSIPNPSIPCRLSVSVDARSVSPRCRRLRVYDQPSGDLIFDTQELSRRGEQDIHLPQIDFAAYPSKEIDIEAEVHVADVRKELRRVLRDLRRRILRPFKLRSSISRDR